MMAPPAGFVFLVIATSILIPGSAAQDVNALVVSFFDYIQGSRCEYECPNGAEPEPIQELYFSPTGCGSYSFSVGAANNVLGVKNCCNIHDMCYRLCGSDKDECDEHFRDCLTDFCNSGDLIKYPYITHSMCLRLSEFGFTTVQSFGCEAYKMDQAAACQCPDNGQPNLLDQLINSMDDDN